MELAKAYKIETERLVPLIWDDWRN